jgi:AcrR family transcriptional regulator
MTLTQTDEATEGKVDGRRAGRERNRLAVVDALLDLYGVGKISPSADEVAEKSGVSRRSLFRYFDDLDDLCRAAIDRQTQRASHLLLLKELGQGVLADRIDRLTAQRAALFEAIAPAARVGRLRAPYQPMVEEDMRKSRALLGRQVERHFAPELDALNPDRRHDTLAALDVLCSFETFDLLRKAQGHSKTQYERTLQLALTALLSGRVEEA